MYRKLVLVFLFLLLGAATLVSAQGDPVDDDQIVRQQADLIATNHKDVGDVEFWNTRYDFVIEMQLADEWLAQKVQVYAGEEMAPTRRNGYPLTEEFNCQRQFEDPTDSVEVLCNLSEELEFTWGQNRDVHVAVHVDMVQLSDKGNIIRRKQSWIFYEPNSVGWKGSNFRGNNWGWHFETEFTHPESGHVIDSPVGGITYHTNTQKGITDLSGRFDYFPKEVVTLSLGSVQLGTTVANHRISPLDLFEDADADDMRVVNMARLLQSLDADANPKKGIEIRKEVVGCLNHAYQNLERELDFSDDEQIEIIIQETIAACADVEDITLASVSAEDAKQHLKDTLSSDMFRKNVSKTPELTSSKSKLNIMGMWFPALRANGDPAVYVDQDGVEQEGIPYYYYNDTAEELQLVRTATTAKPIVIAYTDGVEETGEEDIYAGISRDDGNTFKRKNLSRAADKSSFNLEDGTPYYGAAKKPVFQVKGNNILVAWTSKFCKGGKPTYAIETLETDPEDDYSFDDPYYQEDIWGVGGPQRSVDYAEQDFPEIGEVPYSCVWVARGTVVTQGMINKGGFWAWPEGEVHEEDKYVEGDIVWFKPERLTSGRRDANQIFMGGGDGAGFAIAWQEDPEGLRPGDAAGPGPGWGGATTNHKTDIWYSYVTMTDFSKVDENFLAGGDPQHDDEDFVGRPKALVPMKLPVRVTDNDVVNTDNLMVELDGDGFPLVDIEGNWIPTINPDTSGDGSGSHAYGYRVDGLCEGFYTFINEQEVEKHVCITADNRLLDGDTGASRPNLFLQPYTNNNGTPTDPSDDYKSAWAIFAYEETKGVGGGQPDYAGEDGPHGDEYVPDEGKNAIYHSFDFQNPDLVSAGTIINLPERDAEGNLLYLQDEEGTLILDWLGQPQLTYENARRPRFILQGKSAIGATGTSLITVYKEGQEGQGRPSDIMLRRFVAPAKGNPYAAGNLVCNEWTDVYPDNPDSDLTVCINGAQNMSSVTPTETYINPDRDEDAQGDGVKVVEWKQTPDNLNDLSSVNPYDDARAHRGQIRGDFVVMGFSYTPNWAAARNGNDRYDLYVRRSFDGGQTWTTKAVEDGGEGVEHCITWTDPEEEDKELQKTEVCTFYPPGEFETMRNLSQLSNNKSSVIEPRIVATPGTIKLNGVWTGIDEDKQNKNVFYVSYGTSTNPEQIHGDSDEVQEFPVPLDLYYSFSQDQGESYVDIAWDVNPDSNGNHAGEIVYRWDYLAKGDPEQGEAQLRMTPDGSRFYATWLQESEEGSDIWFRRIMSPEFSQNLPANDLMAPPQTP